MNPGTPVESLLPPATATSPRVSRSALQRLLAASSAETGSPALDPVVVGHAGFVQLPGSADSALQPRTPAVLGRSATQTLMHHVQSMREGLGEEVARRAGRTGSSSLQQGREVDVVVLSFDRLRHGPVLYAATPGISSAALESSAGLMDELQALLVEPSLAPEAARFTFDYRRRKEIPLISSVDAKKMVLHALFTKIGPAIVAADALCEQQTTVAAGDDLGSPSSSDHESDEDAAGVPGVPRKGAAANAARQAADASRAFQVSTLHPQTRSPHRFLHPQSRIPDPPTPNFQHLNPGL